MRFNNKIIYTILTIMILCSTSSCRKWLEVSSDDRIMENTLFDNQEGFLIALNGIYIDLIDRSLYNGTFTASSFDVLAQIWLTNDSKHSSNKLSTFDEMTLKSFSSGIWNKCYNILPNINTLLEHCETDKAKLTSNNYKLIKGEALALRALIHFELFRVFGPICSVDDMSVKTIPYANSSLTEIRPLLTANEIVEKINADLLEAERLLKESDPVITKGPDFIEKEEETNDLKFRNLRMNYYAVKALIARIALHTNDVEKAFTYASAVVKETMEDNKFFPFTSKAFAEQSGYADKVYSSEILFGIYNSKVNDDINNGFFSRNNEDSKVLMMPNAAIVKLYDGFEGDIRKTHLWANGNNPESEPRVYFVKYEKTTASAIEIESMPNKVKHQFYIPIIKISEMLLIMAECKYNSDPKIAIDAINKIRNARNAPDISENSNLLTAIQYEIAREFIGEGQLFWFYKRNNFKTIPLLSYENQQLSMENKRYYFVIPTEEIDARK